MIGKHHLKLDMPGEFSNKVLQKCLTTTNGEELRIRPGTGLPCDRQPLQEQETANRNDKSHIDGTECPNGYSPQTDL